MLVAIEYEGMFALFLNLAKTSATIQHNEFSNQCISEDFQTSSTVFEVNFAIYYVTIYLYLNKFVLQKHHINLWLSWQQCVKCARIRAFSYPYFSAWRQNRRFCPYTGKCGSEKTRIMASFTQCNFFILLWWFGHAKNNFIWKGYVCEF